MEYACFGISVKIMALLASFTRYTTEIWVTLNLTMVEEEGYDEK